MLIELFSQLRITNTCCGYKLKPKYTWSNLRDHKSKIYLIDSQLKQIKKTSHYKEKNITSSHSKANPQQYSAKQVIQTKQKKNPISEDDTEEGYRKVEQNIPKAAEEAVGKMKTTVNARKTKPWFTSEVKRLAANERDIFKIAQ